MSDVRRMMSKVRSNVLLNIGSYNRMFKKENNERGIVKKVS